MGVGVDRAAAELVMCAGERSVRAERVALEAFGVLVEVEMTSMLQAQVRAAGEHQREVGISVTVAVAHAAAEEGHRRAYKRLATEILGLGEPSQEVAELLDGEGVVFGKLFHVARIAAVVAELMARLGDADFGDGEGVSLAAQTEGGHTGHVGLEGQHHKVIDGAEIIACHGGGNVAVGAIAVRVGDVGQRRVEPRIGPACADLCLTHRGKVLFHAPFVRRPQVFIELAHFVEVGVEHAPLATQVPPLDRLTPFRLFKH